MVKVTFTGLGGTVSRYADFQRYTIDRISEKKIVLRFDEDRFGTDAASARAPDRIEVTIRNGTLGTPENGPDAGSIIFTDGQVARLRYFDADETRQVTISDVDMDAALLHLHLRERPENLYDALIKAGGTFVGTKTEESTTIMVTGVGDDVARGKAGASTRFIDGGGVDRYLGTDGSLDEVTYDQWFFGSVPPARGLSAKLNKGVIVGPDGERDSLRSIESVVGTQLNDRFRGDSNDNLFTGLFGSDTLHGGGGSDRAVYRNDAIQGGGDGINANLSEGTVIDAFGTVDTLVRRKGVSTVEDVEGTGEADRMRDDAGDNRFLGHGGNDVFIFSQGDDFGQGGAGADRFVYLGTDFGSDRIVDFEPLGGDVIDIRAAESFEELTILDRGTGAEVRFGNEGARILIEGVSGDLEASIFGF